MKMSGKFLRQAAGWAVAAACLVWVCYDLHIDRLKNQLIHLDWWLIALAVFFDCLSYGAQGLRWSQLLRPLGRISSMKTTQAIYMGLFTNEILPLRAGEGVRAWTVSRWLSKPFVGIIPSIAVDRFFAGFWLITGIGVTALLIELPRELMQAADILGAAVIAAAAAFMFIVFRAERARDIPAAVHRRQRVEFDRITQRGSGAVGFDEVHRRGGHIGRT